MIRPITSLEESQELFETNMRIERIKQEITDFVNSNAIAAEIIDEDRHYKDIHSLSTCYRFYIKQLGFNCKVLNRQGKVFLAKKDIKA